MTGLEAGEAREGHGRGTGGESIVAAFIIKTLLSALVIAAASELVKRSTLLAALLVSLPLTSILSIVFAAREGKTQGELADYSMGIFWFVLPSLVFFLVFSQLMRLQWSLLYALGTSMVTTAAAYHLWMRLLGVLGVKI